MKVSIPVCILFFYLIVGVNTGFCASFNVSDLYQEAAWLSLDLPQSQRAKIDSIIIRNNDRITKITKDAVVFSLAVKKADNEKELNFLSFLKTMQKVNNIQADTCDEIMQCLTPEQQGELEDILGKRSSQVASAVDMLNSLTLDDTQQIKVLNRMLLCQKQIWAIAADTKLSWEQRKKKMQTINTLKLITQYLTQDQKAAFNAYYLMMGE